ncbi:SpvB/TcaC N-terminal domain-containing protein [Vibrio sonorensis]|uniref:SpvB/TcaC N-terminal domain-containing protein n=1 Tax=Vibrio sonorensis TaxID=1004316 RepID=UPI0008D927E5|nr:SpvB/TcaC N-terminal domain-containing protein [Vibrio sonorensis]
MNILTKSKIFALAFLVTSFASSASVVGELTGSHSVNQGKSAYSIPVRLPEGINGLVPNLSISYQQGSGNGPLGLGVQLTGFSTIHRCTKTQSVDGEVGGISFDDSDVYCLDGKRLLLLSGQLGKAGSEYRVNNDWLTKVVAVGNTLSGPESWVVYGSEGYISFYGARSDSKSTNNGHGLEWRLSNQLDRFGNELIYYYDEHQGKFYPSKITYSDVEIRFNYVARNDLLDAYRFGQKQTLAQKLDSIDINRSGALLRQIKLSYTDFAQTDISYTRLNSVTVCDANNNCMRPHVFEWQTNLLSGIIPEPSLLFSIDDYKGFIAGDLNRDGTADICYLKEGLYCSLNTSAGHFSSPVKWSNDFSGNAWEEPQEYMSLALIDINDDNYVDVCGFNEQGFYCATNNGGSGFNSASLWSSSYSIEEAVRLIDTNQDGFIDICRVEDEQVICANNTGSALSEEYVLVNQGFPLEKNYLGGVGSNTYHWTDNIQNHRLVNMDLESASLPASQFIDINGDGFTDFCGIKSNGTFYCAYGTETQDNTLKFEVMRALVSGLPTGSITGEASDYSIDQIKYDSKVTERLTRTVTLTDVSGDSLPDLCYRNGFTYQCHINTGSGFANAQSWLTLPEHHFEISDSEYDNSAQIESSILLSDRNRDGLADFCYVAGDKFYCAYGNGRQFSEPKALTTLLPDQEVLDDSQVHYSNYVRKVFGLKTRIDYISVNSAYGPYRKGVDVDGDGTANDCYRGGQGITCMQYHFSPLALLKSVTSGLGAKTEFIYDVTGNTAVFQPSNAPVARTAFPPTLRW